MNDNFSLVEYIIYLLLPFILAVWFKRRFKVGWKVFWLGVFVFLIANVAYFASLFGLGLTGALGSDKLPFSIEINWLISVLVLALISSVSMESLRWLGLRLTKEKGFGTALMFASGAGGTGLFVNGLWGLFIWISIWAITSKSISTGSTVHLPFVGYDLTLDNLSSADAESFPAFDMVVSRISLTLNYLMPLMLHLGASALIWMSVRQKRAIWFFAALFWHFISNGTFVFVTGAGIFFWAIQKVTVPALAVLTIVASLIGVNIALVVWGYRRSKVIEALEQEQSALPQPVPDEHLADRILSEE
jgi:uncharacterized membrane protein YhfC